MKPDKSAYPGQFLQHYIREHDISQTELAIGIGVKPEIIGAICVGQSPITDDIAAKIACFLGTSKEIWTEDFTGLHATLREI